MIRNYLHLIIKDPKRKSILKIIKEAFEQGYKWKCLPFHYFTRFAYRKNVDPNSYIPNQIFDKYLAHNNLKEYEYLTFDKVVFYSILNTFNIPQPRTIGSCYRGVCTVVDPINKDNNHSFSPTEYLSFFKYLFTQFNIQNLFIKRANGFWGKDAFTLNYLSYEQDKNQLQLLNNGYWIIQERIKQHKILSKINSTSINTLRIDTILNESNTPHLISALLRFGRKDAIIDNVSAGGYFIGIKENGKLKKTAYSFLKTGGYEIDEHPDSKVIFEDIQLPYWEETKELVLRLAKIFLQTKAIGWDIALTEKGPTVIEANTYYHIGMSEIASGGYIKNETFLKHFDFFKKGSDFMSSPENIASI